ncbi:VOC family protein, partial [Acinetobacter baumannii]
TFGDGMVMLGDRKNLPAWMQATGRQSIYVYDADPDAHHDRATAAGAAIVNPLRDTDYGSREYSACDPDGHFWHFGTYRPEVAHG